MTSYQLPITNDQSPIANDKNDGCPKGLELKLRHGWEFYQKFSKRMD